jgi:hypothetical protein
VKQPRTQGVAQTLRLIVDGHYQYSRQVMAVRLAREEFLYDLKAGPAGGRPGHATLAACHP